MDEQQIIDDILDTVYGYSIILKEGDEKAIAQKKKEREEKYNEILNQINTICISIEKELKSVLGIDDVGIKKHIRDSVLTLIKAEVENGNKVIDSNGKINTGKIFDIVNQSKGEILEKIEIENDSLDYIPRENSAENRSQNDNELNELNNFFEKVEGLGIDFTEEDKDTTRIAVERANEVLKYINEKVESGMTVDEAWEQFTEGMSSEEIKELEWQLVLADVVTNFRRKKNDNREDNTTEEKKVESVVDEVSNDQKEENGIEYDNYRNLAMRAHRTFEIINDATEETKTVNEFTSGSNLEKIGVTLQKIMISEEIGSYFKDTYPDDMVFSYGREVFSMNVGIETLQFAVEPNEYLVQDVFIPEQAVSLAQHVTTINEVQSQDGNEHMITQLDRNVKKEDLSTFITTPSDTSLENTNERNAKQIPEKTIDAFFTGKGVDMTVAPFDISKTAATDSKPEMPETTTLISGVEEIVVDDTSEREVGSSEFSVEGIFGSADVKSIVAAIGRAREIVDANEMLQGFVRAEITPEERNSSQGTPNVNDSEVGGEEIE